MGHLAHMQTYQYVSHVLKLLMLTTVVNPLSLSLSFKNHGGKRVQNQLPPIFKAILMLFRQFHPYELKPLMPLQQLKPSTIQAIEDL